MARDVLSRTLDQNIGFDGWLRTAIQLELRTLRGQTDLQGEIPVHLPDDLSFVEEAIDEAPPLHWLFEHPEALLDWWRHTSRR